MVGFAIDGHNYRCQIFFTVLDDQERIVWLYFITEPTQRSVSYSATQMSTIQADIGRSTSLPGSIASIATLEKFVQIESHEEHQPSTWLSLQPSSGPKSALTSNSNSTVVQQDHNRSSIEDEKIQTNIRSNQQAYNLESVAATNHMEKSYTNFQAGMCML